LLHALFLYGLCAMENDLTLGGTGYRVAFGLAVAANVVAFACVANSNPGYVDERDAGERDAAGVGDQTCVSDETSAGDAARVGDANVAGATRHPPSPLPRDALAGDAAVPSSSNPPDAKGKAPLVPALAEEEDVEIGSVGLLGLPGGPSNGSGAPANDEDPEGPEDPEDPEDPDAAERRRARGRVCGHCDAWQGLRTKHCHDCGRCVRKFDHHCFWVGTCVGEKNHARFVTYLGVETALVVWAFHVSNSGARYQTTFEELFEKNLACVLISFALFLCIMFVGGLFAFHMYCAVTNQTTWEVSKRDTISYLEGVPPNVHPFDRGWRTNLEAFCCKPPPKKHVMKSMTELREWSVTETMWDNRYYVCC
jgi:palmitoyltransferase